MEPTDITVHILREILAEIRGTNTRVDGLTQRVDGLNDRVDGLNDRVDRLERRMTESDMRVATGLLNVTAAVNEVRDLLEDRLNLKDRVEQCERDIGALKARVGV